VSPTTAGAARCVLLVEDDPDMRALVQRWLEAAGHRVASFADAETCLAAFTAQPVDAVCLDVGLPGMGGMEALLRIHAQAPDVPVVMLTNDREPTTVVEAMRAGAYDYLAKPLEQGRVQATLRRAVERGRAALAAPGEPPCPAGMIARSPPMQAVLRQIARVAASDVNVLLLGESGTGKELAARAIHAGSARAAGPFVAVNCAAVPEALMESEFFGHEKGSFTGAAGQRLGRIEQARGGTLFLDEIGELGQALQAKLLRVIQERCFHRVGGTAEVRADFRLITATHQDLSGAIAAGHFREDLYYRVAVFELELPPLRERPGDVTPMAQSFAASLGGLHVDSAALEVLERYPWPGNVRELHNVIQRAAVMSDGPAILPQHLPARIHGGGRPGGAGEPPSPGATRLQDLAREALTRALLRHEGNISEVVRELGIGRTTVYRKIKELNLRRAGSAPPGRPGTPPR
jgi:two-component system response regulator AtoC